MVNYRVFRLVPPGGANPAVSGVNLPYKTLSNGPAKTGFTEYRQRTLWCSDLSEFLGLSLEVILSF